VADLRDIGVIKQRELQRSVVFGELANLFGTQRIHPVELLHGCELVTDPRAGEQAPVGDEDHTRAPKSGANLLDLILQRRRIARVALANLDGDGAAVGAAEQAEDNL
jgi:hypothetical protein